jgi:hypothetical protein
MGDLTPGRLIRVRLVIRPLTWLESAEPQDAVHMVHVGSHPAAKWLSRVPVFPELVHCGDGGGVGDKSAEQVQVLADP